MKNIFKKNNILILVSLVFSFSLIISVLFSEVKAQSVGLAVPFSGQIATVDLCCNGTLFTLTPGLYDTYSPAQKTGNYNFMMEEIKKTPRPEIGLGLYQWWALIPEERVLGDAVPAGVCLDPKNDCSPKSYDIPPWNVNKVGTTLY